MSEPTATTTPAAAVAPQTAPADVVEQTATGPQPGLATAPAPRGNAALVLAIIGIVVMSVLALLLAVYLIVGLGSDAAALGGVMALVPLAIVFFGVRWIDRWEPEPRLAVVVAFLWGAAVSVLIALVVGGGVDPVIVALSGGDDAVYQFIGAAIQAPIVEEGAKGLGLLILFFAARRYFDGPVDGIVYAAWVAGGFAFTENILYFGGQIVDAGALDPSVFGIFLVRGIMSPFAHVMFTAAIGIALGLATRRRSRVAGLGYFVVGLVPAILLHGLWNGSLFFVGDFFGYYAVVQFPLFVGAVILVVVLRRQEARLTHDRLAEYAAVGWFAPEEVAVLATGAGRRQALAWAARSGRRAAMKQYIHDATRLAFARQRIIIGRDRIGAEADEAVLLAAILESRRSLTATGV